MKYRDLIQFNPIETIIELRSADDQRKAEELVRSYVMSDSMAELIQARILSQLSLDQVVDNKGVLLVGNYGTGKSHLMSVISAIASSKDYLPLAQNARFREDAEDIAGQFEVLRIEIGSTEKSLRGIITDCLEQDLKKRGIAFSFPDVSTINNNKDALMAMMAAFAKKYGQRGYLVVLDELLDYLKSRKDNELMLDINFLREIGEIIKTTRLRFISGVQEALFENPVFQHVSNSLLKMKDRYEQVLIRSEDIAYVAKHRVLAKTPEQKAMIRLHLEPFCKLYYKMAEQLEEYVELFPIHPAYIRTFQRIITVEKREVLKTISETIGSIINEEVPNEPGIVSYDSYWKRIKANPALKTDPDVGRVLEKSAVLEDIIDRSFTKPAYKPMALRIIYALSVHRLTTVDLDAKLGLTAANLKDDLTLFIQNMPQQDEGFLMSTLNTVLQGIMKTVDGQFIEYNKDNEQFYLDLHKDVDYDRKIQEKADSLGDHVLNRYYNDVMISALEWTRPEHVTGHKIYQYELNWAEKNIFRRGYLFMGGSQDRPTAQPEEDFYIYLLPPFGKLSDKSERKSDEVYLIFQSDAGFSQLLKSYAGAREWEILSTSGETRTTYAKRAQDSLRLLRRWLDEHKTTLFQVAYRNETKPLLEYLKGARMNELTVKGVVDLAASRALSAYFHDKYPQYPRFKNPVTRDNLSTLRQEGINALVGKATQLGNEVLDAFGFLVDGKIRLENSPFASFYIQRLKQLPEGHVLNYADIMEGDSVGYGYDKKFHFDEAFISILLTALVYGGHCVLVAADGKRYDASTMEALRQVSPNDIYQFKRLEKPKAVNLLLLRRLFDVLGLSEGLLASPSTQDAAVEQLQKTVKEKGEEAWQLKIAMDKAPTLWGEALVPTNTAEKLKEELSAVHKTADDIRSRFTTAAKLKNFDYSDQQMLALERGITAMKAVGTVRTFKDTVGELMSYIAAAELKLPQGSPLKESFTKEKKSFLLMRDQLLLKEYDSAHTDELQLRLEELQNRYAAEYMKLHGQYRLNIDGDRRKQKLMAGDSLKTLQALSGIRDILSLNQLHELTSQLLGLKSCYACTTPDLIRHADCPHCHFNPADMGEQPITGRLDQLEDKLDRLLTDWIGQILTALDDPILDGQKALLHDDQRKLIDTFIASRRLPRTVDQDFVESVNAVLSGLESVEIHMKDLQQAMMNWGPTAPEEFKQKLGDWIDEVLRGHDLGKARIVIKG